MGKLFFSFGIIILFVACSVDYGQVEKDVRKELDNYRERYVIAMYTGEVTLPSTNKYPHILHPAPGGMETGMNNVWLINGGYLGEIYECRGCDYCMTRYHKAGLIDYQVFERNEDTVTAFVRLTPLGSRFLIENYVPPFYRLSQWRRREQIEIMLVATEKFELEVVPSGKRTYHCNAHRSLALTPFLKAIGGTEREDSIDYVRQFKVEYDEKGVGKVTRISSKVNDCGL
ncbi:hypothetical protein [Bacteroides caecimuris]|uniref:hypothetical protein n=1 Tax=Bacteroides caecimuris TaxID=1796613 RepID=UPI00242E7D2B|nr:hypothetical protein [Bacteroides caecimuris]